MQKGEGGRGGGGVEGNDRIYAQWSLICYLGLSIVDYMFVCLCISCQEIIQLMIERLAMWCETVWWVSCFHGYKILTSQWVEINYLI